MRVVTFGEPGLVVAWRVLRAIGACSERLLPVRYMCRPRASKHGGGDRPTAFDGPTVELLAT